MSFRKIVVDGEEWRFQVGKRFVKLRGPGRQSHAVEISDILGSYYDFRRREGDASRGAVTPRHVREVIVRLRGRSVR